MDGVVGVRDRLPFGGLADETFIFGESDDGRCSPRAFRVFDHAGLAAIHDGDTAVGGSKVNTDDFSHVFDPSYQFKAMTRGGDPFRHRRHA